MSRFLLIALFLGISACSSLEKSAAKDPQKCERDPKCQERQQKSRDCSTACVDNMDCMQRCEQVNGYR